MSEYDPEIEERRADYDKLAEAFTHMGDVEFNRVPGRLDFDEAGKCNDMEPFVLCKSIQVHLLDLYKRIDMLEPAALKKFYTELRLFGDQQDLDHKKSYTSLPESERKRMEVHQ